MQHIMVIDDDHLTLHLVEQILVRSGYLVSTWSTSAFAIMEIERRQPDLVLLDNHLGYPPTGWGILQDLRFNDTTQQLPVILCSADHVFLAQKADLIHGMGAGILPKPLRAPALVGMIQRMLPSPHSER